MTPTRLLALALASALLAACTPEEFVPTEPTALDGTSLTLEPVPQEVCDPTQPYAVVMRWSVSDWDEPKFDFHIYLDGTKGELWARENTAEGEKTTWPYVRPGMWFVMFERNSRQVVAATPAPALECPAG